MIQVVAGIIIRNKTVLIARRASHKAMAGKWEFPGGKIEVGETPQTALEREILEEFGVVIKAGTYIASNIHDYGDLQIELRAYHARYVNGEFELTDHDQIAWVDKKELENYEKRGVWKQVKKSQIGDRKIIGSK